MWVIRIKPDEDLLMVIGGRKGSLSYTGDMESMGAYLGKHFARHNITMIIPAQFGA